MSASPAVEPAVRVSFEPAEPRTGEPLRVRIHGDGSVDWRVGWSVIAGQAVTNVQHLLDSGTVTARADGAPIDVALPDGAPPSFDGEVFTLTWWVWVKPEGRDSEVVRIPVRPGPARTGLAPLQERGRAWLASDRLAAVPVHLWRLIGMPVLAVVLVAGSGASALEMGGLGGALLAGIGLLIAVGAVRYVAAELAAWARDFEGRRAMDVSAVPLAFPGASFELPVKVDPTRYRGAGAIRWALLRREGRAHRVETVNSGGRAVTETQWAWRSVGVASGDVPGPPWTDRVLEIPIPADAPATLDLEHQYVRYDVELRCGRGQRRVAVWVAPYAGLTARR